ncbi:hypothetical protein GQ53DRAFT_384067 [Thozetella sp. PMI_491]|nr:hypothetical protein GQ53DRAFT_384067 [Thozetella sp. PMI_491]
MPWYNDCSGATGPKRCRGLTSSRNRRRQWPPREALASLPLVQGADVGQSDLTPSFFSFSPPSPRVSPSRRAPWSRFFLPRCPVRPATRPSRESWPAWDKPKALPQSDRPPLRLTSTAAALLPFFRRHTPRWAELHLHSATCHSAPMGPPPFAAYHRSLALPSCSPPGRSVAALRANEVQLEPSPPQLSGRSGLSRRIMAGT